MTRAEQDELILAHLPQSEILAAKIYRHIRKRMPLEDLKQYGALGLVAAAANFEPERGLKFKTYAEYKIRGAILDGIRKETGWRSGLDENRTPPAPLVFFGERTNVNMADDRSEHEQAALEARKDSARLLKALRSNELTAVTKVYLGEKTCVQAAKEMRVSNVRVWQLLGSARKKMRAAAA